MTWSIVAREARTGALGVAIASRFFAVGGFCPFIRTGAGALSTQATGHPPYGPRALDRLAAGIPAARVLAELLADDPKRENRQIHVVDASGRSAVHTGRDCSGWCGHLADDQVTVAGNLLTGPEVVHETMEAYRRGAALPFAERLLQALEAGQAAGGDRRGQQAAGLLIHAGGPFPALDLRVDDDEGALAELRRLLTGAARDYIPCLRRLLPPEAAAAVYGPARR